LRNVVLLAVAQTVSMSGVAALLLVGGIIGADLAPTRGLATLSISLTVVGVALSTVPAAMIMQRVGRRAGFAGAAALAALAMLVCAQAVAARNFWLFCAGTMLVGVSGAFAQQYRFAAAESVPPASAGRAVSMVLVGGIAAGWLGPELATRTRDWIDAAPYAGTFAAQGVLYVAAALLLLGLREVAPPARGVAEAPRRLGALARDPAFVLAVLAATTSYAVMSFIMTATPLELHDVRHFDLRDTAWVIQSHVMAMYVPSLVTGSLIARFGLRRVMLVGTACLSACALAALISHELVHYWAALVVLGVGWNFQFVAATVLLARAARPEERFRAQAVNDFTVFAVQALASLSAAGVLFAVGWTALNLIAVPLLALTALAAFRAR
jgi:predicted MFS family arabinose efflux permease